MTRGHFAEESPAPSMGNALPPGMGPGGAPGGEKKKKKREYTRKAPKRVGRKKKKGPSVAQRLPKVTPTTKCKLRQMKLERTKDFLLLEEEFIRNQERLKPKEKQDQVAFDKVDEIRGTPMTVGNLEEMIDDTHAIVSHGGPKYYVSIMSFVDQDQLEPGCSVLLHSKLNHVLGILADNVDPMVSVMKVETAPDVTYADIGGLDVQIQEIKESVELPLTHPELYDDIGIRPPKGVILYGKPGTGKTLLAKAVANSTSATFLRVVGSELIQKYLGEGPKMVRELFRVADENAPTIIFIDEIDAIGTKRYSSNSGGEKEIQRTMLELLTQLDGFDERGDVKVIMATNNIDALDPALLRPGRIDRKIEFPLPDQKTKRHIFNIHTSKMSLSDDVDTEVFVMGKSDLSGADIKAICSEAGMLALRERRMKVTQEDFVAAEKKALYSKKGGIPEGLYVSIHVLFFFSLLVLFFSHPSLPRSLPPSFHLQVPVRMDRAHSTPQHKLTKQNNNTITRRISSEKYVPRYLRITTTTPHSRRVLPIYIYTTHHHHHHHHLLLLPRFTSLHIATFC